MALRSSVPQLVMHADWGSEPRKRWTAKAISERKVPGSRSGSGGDPATLVGRMAGPPVRTEGGGLMGSDLCIFAIVRIRRAFLVPSANLRRYSNVDPSVGAEVL